MRGAGEDELVLHGIEGVHGRALRKPAEDYVRVPLLLCHLPPGLLRRRHGDVHDLLGERARLGFCVLPETRKKIVIKPQKCLLLTSSLHTVLYYT